MNSPQASRRRRRRGMFTRIDGWSFETYLATSPVVSLDRPLSVVEGDIEGPRGMRERADADPIDARAGDRADRRQGNSARGFEQDIRRALVAPPHRLLEHRGVKVVHQD